jgi:hypothetical protein
MQDRFGDVRPPGLGSPNLPEITETALNNWLSSTAIHYGTTVPCSVQSTLINQPRSTGPDQPALFSADASNNGDGVLHV